MKTSALNIFFPGGPCISGKYWDWFIEKANFEGTRISYINHESTYCSSENVTFDQLVEASIGSILRSHSSRKINLIGHSFGSWIALEALKSQSLAERISRVILISLPTKVSHPENIQKAFKEIFTKEINSNASFKSFWMKVLPLYFEQPYENFLELLTNEVFFEGNENIDIDQNRLNGLLTQISNAQVTMIYGEKDKITPKCDSFQNLVIPRTGHFPMLEDVENFTTILNRTLNK